MWPPLSKAVDAILEEPGCGVGTPMMFVSPLAALTLSESPLWKTLTGEQQADLGYHAIFSSLPVKVMRDWNDYMPPTVVSEPEPAGADEGYRIVRTPYTVAPVDTNQAALAKILRAEALTRHLADLANAVSDAGLNFEFLHPSRTLRHQTWDKSGGSIAGEWLTELVTR